MPAADLTLSASNAGKYQQLQGVGKNTVVAAIRSASDRTGVDFAYLLDKAAQESSFNPQAKSSTSSASGLYQFIGQTWLRMVKEHGAAYGLGKEAAAITIDKNGQARVEDKEARAKILNLRYDPVLSSAMAAEFTKENKDYLEAKLDRSANSTDLYLAHFMGAGGAEKFLKAMQRNPHASAAELFPDAAEANRSVFYGKNGHAQSLQQIYDRFAKKFEGGSDGLALAAAEPNAAPYIPLIKALSVTDDTADMPVHLPREMQQDLDAWKQNRTTAETLFSVMTLAQQNISTALHAISGKREDGRVV